MVVSAVIGVVFDFDDTLVPDSTSKLLCHHHIDDKEFWVRAKALVQSGYDPALAFLKLLLDNIGPGKKLGELTNDGLREFGKSLDTQFFPGLPDMFDDLREKTRNFKDIGMEFYIVSGGLQPLIEGSEIIRDNFKAIYGCQLDSDGPDKPLKYIKRCVTFTEKTRYLFEINKGLEPAETLGNPVLVNRPVDPAKRKIPFRNMIYVGDGLTDVPCFSLLKEKGGWPFGVFDPGKETSAKQALQQFLKPDRVISCHSPKYGPEDDLGSLLRATVGTICTKIKLEKQLAESIE